MKRKLIYAGIAIATLSCVAMAIVFQSARSEIKLGFLRNADLIVAFQQPWAWNHWCTRQRTRKYEVHNSFDDTLQSARKELIPLGWTQHRIPSSNQIFVFKERVGGYSVGVEDQFDGKRCRVTVSDPMRSAGAFDKLVAWAQGFDPRYVSAGQPVMDAYRRWDQRQARVK